MSNTIPPLLCSTPPPIDFDDGGGENEPDDFEPFESAQGVYGHFEGPSEPNSPRHQTNTSEKELDLPIPDFIPFSSKLPIDTSKRELVDQSESDSSYVKDDNDKTMEIKIEQQKNSTYFETQMESNDKPLTTKDSIGFILSEPPPIDIGYSSESQSPKNSRGDSPLSIEFSPGNLSDDDASIDFQINESRYDDNTSLPSLKFDAINISKSATPISEDKSITDKSPVLHDLQAVDKDENQSAFDSAISIENTDPDPDTCVADVLPKNTDIDIKHENEAAWEASTFEDSGQSEMFVSKGTSEEEIQSISVEERIAPEISEHEIPDLNCAHSEDQEIIRKSVANALDDDFTDDFQAFEVFDGVQTEYSKNIVNESCNENKNDEVVFEADFSQVDFPPIQLAFSDKTGSTTMSINHSNTIDEIVDDDFEDFQDFKAVAPSEPDSKLVKCDNNLNKNDVEISKESDETNKCENNDNDDDDDFGDFSDFKEASVVNTAPVVEQSAVFDFAKIDEKLKTVLQMMFPTDVSSSGEKGNDIANLPRGLEKNLALDLRDIDSAKALEYQWLHSNMKTSLVKSLGIDSRNILYGEKWNSSMPRFAANLGFGPLEPIKPTKLPSDSSSMLQPLKANSSVSTDKSSISNNGTSDVPAVKFDWNTSGLVNPLDASHAHTLLLDLDQLVVVANLDKIKLDSSSPCASAPLTRTTTISTPTNIAYSSGDNIATASTFDCLRDSCLSTTVYQHLDKTEILYTDDKYVDVMRLDFERNVADGHFGGGGGGGFGDENTTWIMNHMNNLNLMTSNNLTTNTYTAFTANNLNCINATNRVTNTAPLGYVNDSHNDIFDQYLDCRVKEILHEGKAETIHTTEPNDSNESDDVATADQNTTTTSQTPINFIPSLPSIDNDLNELHDSKEQITSNTNQNLRSDENFIAPSNLSTPKLIPLKETHIFTPSKSECTISRSVTKASEKVPIDFDYEIAAAGIVIDEKVVNKEYRDVVYNPDAQIRSSEILVAEISHEEKYNTKEQINPMVDPNKNFRQKSAAPDLLSGPILNIMEKKQEPAFEVEKIFEDEFSDFQRSTQSTDNRTTSIKQPSRENLPVISTVIRGKGASVTSNNIQNKSKVDTIDDEFTDFQSVAPPEDTSQSKTISDMKPRSRTETPGLNDEMILSPAVLLPQAVKLTSSEPKINWPGNSDIDPEELARLEQLFPQAKQVVTQSFVQNVTETSTVTSSPKKESKDDDDWSDFVSVTPSVGSGNVNQQSVSIAAPSTTKLSTISKTYDDEDWCDFVSSTSAPVQPITKPWSISQMPPPQFSSWNQPSIINNLPTLGKSQGGYDPASNTSHPHLTQQNYNSFVPTIPGKSGHPPNIYTNGNQFLVNGRYNQGGTYQKPQLHYNQQNNMYANQQHLPKQQHQFQKQQRASLNSNTNINVLKSQLNLAPSISLIPDLSFSAPKSLVNLSRTNTSTKK